MAEAISDRHVVGVLRAFVRANRPLLAALRDANPLGLRDRTAVTPDDGDRTRREAVLDWASSVNVPGTAAWAAMGADERTDWWIGRVGRLTSVLAAVPGLGGALARRLPVQDIVGVAGQGLLVCAIAGEHGVRDEDEQVRLLAAVLFRREVPAALAGGAPGDDGAGPAAVADDAAADAVAAELTGDLTAARRAHGRATVPALARTVWRMGRSLWSLGREIDTRPQGRGWQRALGNLPVVGVLGSYLGERSALRRVARETLRRLP